MMMLPTRVTTHHHHATPRNTTQHHAASPYHPSTTIPHPLLPPAIPLIHCKASTQSAAIAPVVDEFETAEQMLRPAPRKGDSPLWNYHKKNFRSSRFPTYDLDFEVPYHPSFSFSPPLLLLLLRQIQFKNMNSHIAADAVLQKYGNSWGYRLTIMRGNAESRADTGEALLATAREMISKGTPPDVKWYETAREKTKRWDFYIYFVQL